jgi:geranylgeranyl transferase type-2 subunit beta
VKWIDESKLIRFILECQDPDAGGISDRPGDQADIFHTFFGISGLSLLGYFNQPSDGSPWKYESYREIDPTYALPKSLVEKLGLPYQRLPPV